MPNGKPPFRADHVGSLLRPPVLREARAARSAGQKSDAEVREVEDRCIVDAIREQKNVGLRAVTDGEYRRAFWHFDFLAKLGGVDVVEVVEMMRHAESVEDAAGVRRIAVGEEIFAPWKAAEAGIEPRVRDDPGQVDVVDVGEEVIRVDSMMLHQPG